MIAAQAAATDRCSTARRAVQVAGLHRHEFEFMLPFDVGSHGFCAKGDFKQRHHNLIVVTRLAAEARYLSRFRPCDSASEEDGGGVGEHPPEPFQLRCTKMTCAGVGRT